MSWFSLVSCWAVAEAELKLTNDIHLSIWLDLSPFLTGQLPLIVDYCIFLYAQENSGKVSDPIHPIHPSIHPNLITNKPINPMI